MLTVSELLALETGQFTAPRHARALTLTLGGKTLSLASLIRAVEKQKRGYYVQIRSSSILAGATTVGEVQARFATSDNLLQPKDLSTLAQVLQGYGVQLKLVTSDGRGLLAGTVSALASVPTTPVTQISMLDVQSGTVNVATGLLGLGATLMTIAAIPEPASPVLFFVGVLIASAAEGALIGTGAGQIQDATQAQPQPSSSNDQVPQPDGSDVSIPDAEVFGDFPDGLNPSTIVNAIAYDLAGISGGFDTATGSETQGIPGLGDSGDGEGDLGGGSGGFGLGGGSGEG